MSRRRGRGGMRVDQVIVDEAPGLAAVTPPPPPDLCPVHHMPRDQVVMVDQGGRPTPTQAGVFCDLWHETAPLRAAFAATVKQILAEPAPHTVVPPAFRRPVPPVRRRPW